MERLTNCGNNLRMKCCVKINYTAFQFHLVLGKNTSLSKMIDIRIGYNIIDGTKMAVAVVVLWPKDIVISDDSSLPVFVYELIQNRWER